MQQVKPMPTAKPVYVPLTQYQPVFASVAPVQTDLGIPPDVMGILQTAEVLSIRQHVKILPKHCFSCPPCVKQENTYSVYAGFKRDAQAEFLRLDEVSDDWNRCCCTPYHPLRLEARQYVPPPGAAAGSDWQNLYGDVDKDWGAFTAGRKQQYMRDIYRNQPVLFTMVRDDGQRCCLKCPCKWLDTFVCFHFCQDGMHVYAGAVEDPPEGEKGRNKNNPQDRLMGSINQPIFGGCCIPVLHMRGPVPDTDTPFAKLEGPCIFGGWSEMCCSFKFFVSAWDSKSKAGDVALITKQKPQSIGGALTELGTDADNYLIEFNPEAKLSGAQKATLLTAQVLADYMFFDGNTEKCKADDSGITCYLWYCSVLGWLMPCYVHFPRPQG